MTKVVGIVAEYNPFHNGHLYHVQRAKEKISADYVVAIMSGNFTQRGEPAIIDKWARTQMALENGVDLVLELPTLYACQTAELFAFGAIQSLEKTGIITHLAFGSEYEDLLPIKNIADILAEEPPLYKSILKDNLGKGLSFPAARTESVKKYLSDTGSCDDLSHSHVDDILGKSNSILALEYLKALRRLDSSIRPVLITRKGSPYNAPHLGGQLSSATSIRNAIFSKKDWTVLASTMPKASLDIIKKSMDSGKEPISLNSFRQLILGLLRRSTRDEIGSWMDVEEGLENRIKKSANKCADLDTLLSMIKTKRYTHTRLQRILIHGLLDIKTSHLQYFKEKGGPMYLRVLGFNGKALSLIRLLKSKSSLPLIIKASNFHRYRMDDLNQMFNYDILASDLYSLAFQDLKGTKAREEFSRGPLIV